MNLLAVFAGALLPTVALAQDDDSDDQEIVVTAPLEGSRIESLQGAEVLRRDDSVAQLNGGLGDTLDSTPGIATTFFGAGASRPIIRGLGEDRVRVLQNGIGAIDASTASPDHAVTSDGLDAERIEVLRGAAALAYGGNAIGGVVNVIDQTIPTRAIDGMSFDGLTAYSSVDNGLQSAGSLGFGAGPFAVRLSAAARDTDPYETPIGEALNQWTSVRSYGVGGSWLGDWGFAGLAVKHRRAGSPLWSPEFVRLHEEFSGTVEQAIATGPYTYFALRTPSGQLRWVVTMSRAHRDAKWLHVESFGSREDFASLKLQRRFKRLYFVSVRKHSG